MSTVWQCKTDQGRRRERSGACARAAPMGQGVGRVWRPPAPRGEHARPFSDEFFGVLGLTRARQSFLARQQGRMARRQQEWSRSFLRCAPHPALHFSCMRARSLDTQVRWATRRKAASRKGSRRGTQKCTGHRQWMAAKGADLRPAAGEASVS